MSPPPLVWRRSFLWRSERIARRRRRRHEFSGSLIEHVEVNLTPFVPRGGVKKKKGAEAIKLGQLRLQGFRV